MYISLQYIYICYDLNVVSTASLYVENLLPEIHSEATHERMVKDNWPAVLTLPP